MAGLAVSITPLPLAVGAAARELQAASGETGPISVSVPAPAVRAATLRAPAAPMAVMPLVVRPVAVVVVVAALKAHSFRPRAHFPVRPVVTAVTVAMDRRASVS